MEKFITIIKCAAYSAKGENRGFYLYPRSSIAKHDLMMANGIGIIDAGYRGELIMAIRNVSYDEEPYISRGMRLVQICMSNLKPFDVEFVDELDETIRGNGGFGSTN